MTRELKLKALQKILKTNENAPEQGSKAWLESRLESVGGSEIAAFMQDIPNNKSYNTIRNIIESKWGHSSFRGNIYTRWGNFCEELTRLHCENIFKSSIHETGALPGSFPNHHYSPDGLGVVDKIHLKPFVPTKLYRDLPDSCFVLFEFKNPYSRIPDGNIPVGYMIQIQTGLNDIVQTDIGIYADMVVRQCALEDLNWTNKYNNKLFPKDSLSEIFMNGPESIGFVGVAKARDDDESETFDEEIWDFDNMHFVPNIQFDDNCDCIDFGSATPADFETMIRGVNKKHLIPYYTSPKLGEFKFYTHILAFEKFCDDNDYEMIGILPYKIFQCPIVHLEKDTEFIKDHHKELIKTTINFIKDHKTKSKKKQIEILDEFYPKRSSKKTIV